MQKISFWALKKTIDLEFVVCGCWYWRAELWAGYVVWYEETRLGFARSGVGATVFCFYAIPAVTEHRYFGGEEQHHQEWARQLCCTVTVSVVIKSAGWSSVEVQSKHFNTASILFKTNCPRCKSIDCIYSHWQNGRINDSKEPRTWMPNRKHEKMS